MNRNDLDELLARVDLAIRESDTEYGKLNEKMRAIYARLDRLKATREKLIAIHWGVSDSEFLDSLPAKPI